jgi:phosphoesterase RecJ-like protein
MYRRLPGSNRIIRTLKEKVDLAIAVDCNTAEMLGKTYQAFTQAKDILEIDHHEFRRPFGTVSFVDPEAVAVGEMVYLLLKRLKVGFTKEIAQNILTSLIVETNSFKLPHLRPLTFNVCAEMLKTGVNFHRLTEMVYWTKTRETAVLSGTCLSRCVFLAQGALAWSMITKKDFKRIRGKDEDVDAVADEMRSIKGVKIAALFREKDKKTLRVSLRSKGKINVGGVAEAYGGGGHFDVAGCIIPNTPSARAEILRKLKQLL